MTTPRRHLWRGRNFDDQLMLHTSTAFSFRRTHSAESNDQLMLQPFNSALALSSGGGIFVVDWTHLPNGTAQEEDVTEGIQ